MLTFQDYLEVSEKNKGDFVQHAIVQHRNDKMTKTAKTARKYFEKRNVTIMEFQKMLYTISGKAIPDNFSANYKLRSSYLYRFIIQEQQYLLGNGVAWEEESTKDKLGKDFDAKLQLLAEYALVSGLAFGFWNLDHLEVFDLTEFCPLWDEEDGSLKAGIRYWQIDDGKPVRATLYELDGYTDYIWNTRDNESVQVLNDKRSYKQKVVRSVADGEQTYNWKNYDGFPIVPLWNVNRQSELEGLRESIDCYDLIKSGFANNVDEASYIYWAIQNAGGMDDIDLATFVERMKTLHAALVEDDGAKAEAHSIEAPYASREALLNRLRSDLYEDAMALDTKSIADGAITATQIRAAYEPLNSKTDKFEYLILNFIDEILKLAQIDDNATFTRSKIINTQEEVQMVIQAGAYLTQEYVTKKIVTLLGDGDQADEIITQMFADDMARMGADE